MPEKAPERIEFEDTSGNRIALVTEFYGPYVKFYAEHYIKKEDELRRSRPAYWEGESEMPARKAAELVAKGWRRKP